MAVNLGSAGVGMLTERLAFELRGNEYLRLDMTALLRSAGHAPGSDVAASSIVPDPGDPGIPANVSATITTVGDYSIATGATLFAEAIAFANSPIPFSPFWGVAQILLSGLGGDSGNINNSGAIWNRYGGATSGLVAIATRRAVTNSGTIVAEATDSGHENNALAVYFERGLGLAGTPTLANSGQIFAITPHGDAVGVLLAGTGIINNSGLIAAQSGEGPDDAASAIKIITNGILINEAGGSIMAEGRDAVAVELGGLNQPAGQSAITNYGLIEAHSESGDIASIGILLHGGSLFGPLLDNSGTVRADIALLVATEDFVSPQTVTNRASGEIDGLIFMGVGADALVNSGVINGIVLMDFGNDTVDTSLGTINGYTDLSYGGDSYAGGAGDDGALGGRGDDQLSGGGGQDLLLGGFGDDILTGGPGSDGLFGEWNNDVIYAGAGDFIVAGDGDDRIVLADFGGLYGIEGEAGFDTLAFATGSRKLDLTKALSADTIHGVDGLELGSAMGLVVRAADVETMTDAHRLVVETDASNTVYLIAGWTETGTEVVNGSTYRVFALDGEAVLVENGAAVNIQSQGVAGAKGFDAVPPTPPPLPNPDFLSSDVTDIASFEARDDLVIYENEIWRSVDGYAVLAGDCADITNYGRIESTSHAIQASAVYVNSSHIDNHGVISSHDASASGTASTGLFLNYGDLHNSSDGRIESISDKGIAFGVLTYMLVPFVNDGEIYVRSDSAPRALAFPCAIGVETFNAGFVNNGTVEVIGDGAYGYRGHTQITNTGTITVTSTGPDPSIAFANAINLVNSGTIRADIAILAGMGGGHIQNSGVLEGSMDFTTQDYLHYGEVVENFGTMSGVIHFGNGEDVYDGHDGFHSGAIFGEGDNDTLICGAGDDILGGGKGDDHLDGGLGSDTATYAESKNGVVLSLLISGEQNVGGGQGTDTLVSIENLEGSSKDDTLTGNDLANALAGGAGNDFLYGGAERDTLNGGAGNDLLDGGYNNDTLDLSGGGNDTAYGGASGGEDVFLLGAALNAADIIDGSGGDDVVNLAGDYSAGMIFNATTMINVETIVVAAGFDYSLELHNATVALHKDLTVDGSALGAGDTLHVDGSKELDGSLHLLGGAGADTLIGGHKSDTLSGGDGDDTLTGGKGVDHMDGGLGSDIFAFAGGGESGLRYDTIVGFDGVADRIDLTTAITAVDAVMAGALSADSFKGDIKAVAGKHALLAHHAMLFTADAGDLAGQLFLIVDIDGRAGYGGHDVIVHLDMPANIASLSTANFI